MKVSAKRDLGRLRIYGTHPDVVVERNAEGERGEELKLPPNLIDCDYPNLDGPVPAQCPAMSADLLARLRRPRGNDGVGLGVPPGVVRSGPGQQFPDALRRGSDHSDGANAQAQITPP